MDKLPLVNVTARILDQNGKPVPRARVSMRLTTNERYCGLVVPRETAQMTDANGKAILRVFPNELGSEGSEYLVTISYVGDGCTPCGKTTGSTVSPGAMRHFYVTVPNADCDLFDITDLPPYEQRGSGQVLPAEVASYASQASNAADRAQNIAETVGAIRTDIEAIADNADAAKQAAQAAATQAQGHERRAKDLVDGVQSSITHFECAVVERTEETANRLTTAATSCIKQAENTALLAIEARSSESLNELAIRGTEIQQGALAAIATSRENAIEDIDHTRREALAELREEAALFGEDFEALTERAESAAKRAGCSAAAAANSATKACLCADRAEAAADRAESAKVEAVDSASKAEKAHACAHADAICAENAATAAHMDAGKAEASACAAEKSAEMADCCAKKACKCAEVAGEMRDAVAGDKAYIEGDIIPRLDAAIKERTDKLAELQIRQDQEEIDMDILESRMNGFEELVKNHAKHAHLHAHHAHEMADRAENSLCLIKGENIDFSWRLPAGAKSGATLDLPGTFIVGMNMLRLSWGGMLMYPNVQYRELGEPGEASSKVQLLMDIAPNASMNVWIAAPRVSGDLIAAEEKAEQIISRLANAESQTGSAVAGLEDTLTQIIEGGDIQVERAKAEADRAELEATKVGQLVSLAQGANLETQWFTETAYPKNTLLTLPVTYIAGRNSLRLFWGGMLMSQGAHYEEIGEPDTVSRHVKLLIDLPQTAHMDAWSVATGVGVDELHEKIALLQELLTKAEEAVKVAEEARDKALAAAAAAVTGTISMVDATEVIEERPDGYFVIGQEPEDNPKQP